MATATSTINNNNDPANYHTVVICSDLPQINKYYSNETAKDLPPTDYWIKKVDKQNNKGQYKVQHIVGNGPCA